jgi:hypothetical protein
MPKPKQEFDAVMEAGDKGGMWVNIPFNVEEAYGTHGQVKVKARIDGEAYRGSLAPYEGIHRLGVLKTIREKLKKGAGDTVHVILEPDTEPRVVEIPEDLHKALNRNRAAKEVFERLSYTHRKEYIHWIEEAKKAETRAARVAKAVEMIAEGKTGVSS